MLKLYRGAMVVFIFTAALSVGFSPQSIAYSKTFPKPPELEPQVRFWKDIFTKYSRNQGVLHDNRYLDKIYSVIELPPLVEGSPDERRMLKRRSVVLKREKRRVTAILDNLQKTGKPTSAGEQEIWRLFKNIKDQDKFLAAKKRLRIQIGVRERFRDGLERASRYLPLMETIFRQQGLPVELTRLPLIESSFNIAAYSSAAAAGIWQFIPSSARRYGLQINDVADDRRDPLLATTAAARHLNDDIQLLRAWPLAVTAYNHGRSGVARAVNTVGSTRLPTIIENYKSRRFGFASRNFYAEFVAALEVYRERSTYFKGLNYAARLDSKEVTIDHYVTFPTLARLAQVTVDEFHSLNPRFNKEVVDGKLRVPAGTRLNMSAQSVSTFHAGYAQLGPNERFTQQVRLQPKYVYHKVRRGQSLGLIARRYGTSIRTIRSTNKIRNANRIRIGQVLKIPRGPGTKAVSAASKPKEKYRSHRVARGQTVSTIARRYGTNVRTIRQVNGLSNVHKIRIGQVLKIPAT